MIVGCVIVAARVLSLVGLRSFAVCGVGGAVLFAIVCLASVGRDVVRLRIARPTGAEAALVLLALSGALAGRAGGASSKRAAVRVLIGGGLAMAVTAVIGRVFGAVV